MTALDLAQASAVAVSVLLISLALYPFQVRLLKLLEGYWPAWGPFAALYERGVRRQRALRDLADFGSSSDADKRENRSRRQRLWDRLVEDIELQRRREKDKAQAWLLRMPPDTRDSSNDRLMPTTLGNALRYREDLAGERRYSMQAVRVVPYLFAVAPSEFIRYVNDARTNLDIAASFTWTWFLATLIGVVTLVDSGLWMLVPVVTILLSLASYRAAINSAAAYGDLLVALVDLYRFDLYGQLHERLPRNLRDERALNRRLSRIQSAQNGEHDHLASYHHGE